MSIWVIVIDCHCNKVTINKGLKQSTSVEFCQMFLLASSKISGNFLIFGPILTKFLPKCRAQNVDSEKGHGAGEKGHGAAP